MSEITPPWKDRLKPRHRRQEERLSKSIGGQTHPASGRIWRFKRDGRIMDFLIESRTTEEGSYSISKKEFLDIKNDAHRTPPGCMPAMQIDIGEVQLFVCEFAVWEEMLNQLVSLQGMLDASAE